MSQATSCTEYDDEREKAAKRDIHYRRFTDRELRELNMKASIEFSRMFLRTVEIQQQLYEQRAHKR